jgi:hypothetical protein
MFYDVNSLKKKEGMGMDKKNDHNQVNDDRETSTDKASRRNFLSGG